LVGRNGSGKSTSAALLAGLYKPKSGSIVLSDGTDLRGVSNESRKNLIQVIPQSTALFNMSILENVRYAKPDATAADVKRALSLANCDDIVSKKDGGLDFVVGLNGCKLSGGEQQVRPLSEARNYELRCGVLCHENFANDSTSPSHWLSFHRGYHLLALF